MNEHEQIQKLLRNWVFHFIHKEPGVILEVLIVVQQRCLRQVNDHVLPCVDWQDDDGADVEEHLVGNNETQQEEEKMHHS